MSWIKSNVDDNSPHLPSLVSHLRLAQLPTAYLLGIVCTEELIRRDTVCRDYLDEAKHHQMSEAQLVPPQTATNDRVLPRRSYAGPSCSLSVCLSICQMDITAIVVNLGHTSAGYLSGTSNFWKYLTSIVFFCGLGRAKPRHYNDTSGHFV